MSNLKLFLSYLIVIIMIYEVTCLQATVHYLSAGRVHSFNNYKDTGGNALLPVIYCYAGHQKQLLRMFETVLVRTNISPDQYDVYEGATPAHVMEQFEQKNSLWRLLPFVGRQQLIKLDPFNSTCIGIHTHTDYDIQLNVIRVDYWRIIMLASGLLLFLAAPKLSNNSLFYYICGITFGNCASFLILVYIMSRLLPFRKTTVYASIIGGWTVGLYLFQILWDNIRVIAMNYKNYLIGYFVVTSVISFVVCYRWGPVSNQRSKNLIKWALQTTALALIFWSSHFQEATLAIDIILLVMYNFPWSLLTKLIGFCKRKIFTPKLTLLTEDEYQKQGIEETNKALKHLRGYCSSPECNQWKTVLKLKDPCRFAKFVEGGSHLADDEILAYQTESKKAMDDLFTDDSDETVDE